MKTTIIEHLGKYNSSDDDTYEQLRQFQIAVEMNLINTARTASAIYAKTGKIAMLEIAKFAAQEYNVMHNQYLPWRDNMKFDELGAQQ